MSEPVKVTIVQETLVESLWAESLSDGHYRIDNIPLEIHNISLGDVIICHSRDEMLYFDELYDKSGNQTVRINVPHGLSSAEGAKVIQLLEADGALYETYSDMLVSASIPPGVDVELLLTQVEKLAKHGVAYQKLDPSPRVQVPVAAGSPAEAKRDQRSTDTRKFLEDLIKQRKDSKR